VKIRAAFVVLALAHVACAAPSSYDGLTGGSKVDDAIAAPRPVSPVSVSMVATSRPRFKWELAGDATGAVVELARTRAFDGDVRRFPASGRELVVPEDLEPGIWFWRLVGRTADKHGTKPSVVWEVLVRGPAAHGSSDAPAGAIVDFNGDGLPDLLAGLVEHDDKARPGDPADWPLIVAYPGTPDGSQDDGAGAKPFGVFDGDPQVDGQSLGGGIDVDGDGFTDVVHAGADAFPTEAGPLYVTHVEYGSEKGFDMDRSNVLPFMNFGAFYPGVRPVLREAGDINGDGFGDIVAGGDDLGYVTFGTRSGPSAVLPLDPSPPGNHSRAIIAAFDADADGLGDVVIASSSILAGAGARRTHDPKKWAPFGGGLARGAGAQPDPGTDLPSFHKGPAFAARGSADMRVNDGRGLKATRATNLEADDASASAFASGDFDGDGLSDVAVTLVSNGSSAVCVWFGSRESFMVEGPCVRGLAGDTRFGAEMTAGDLEGDGVDELVVSAVSAGPVMRAVRFTRDAAEATPVGPAGFGARLTTIWPGRPGKARWAAASADGASIAILEGTEVRQSIHKASWMTSLGTALR